MKHKRSPEEQETWERVAMGCTAKELKGANRSWELPRVGRLMMAMSILSDVQEIALVEDVDDRIRQYVNRAKLFLIEEIETRKEVE